ncbi:MAG TPA: hypothetical protein DCM70_05245 [Rhodobacteraceae bacterium]|nr:hypothetical protein [Paracoccaceae bacterium]
MQHGWRLHHLVCAQLQPKTGLSTRAEGEVMNLPGFLVPHKHCAACAKRAPPIAHCGPKSTPG